MYRSEQNFLSTKIYPNIPKDLQNPFCERKETNQSTCLSAVKGLDCRGVTLLTGVRPANMTQAAWVGFWGSGNHMMKYLLEMVTGLKTVGGLVGQENGRYYNLHAWILKNISDGSFLQFNHHTTASNRLRGLFRLMTCRIESLMEMFF